MRLLLIDGDMIAYHKAAAHETAVEWEPGQVSYHADLEATLQAAKDWIEEFTKTLNADEVRVAFSHHENFRKKILPEYKSNRKDKHKPLLLGAVKNHLESLYHCQTTEQLEADDVLGIWATDCLLGGEGPKIIVAEDKDMKQIPGFLWSPRVGGEPAAITPCEADRWHMMQTLMGDPSDGYKGLPRVGVKKAEKILSNDQTWGRVLQEFLDRGFTEEYALSQARVSRICRFWDYDHEKKEPILWQPTNGKTQTTSQ